MYKAKNYEHLLIMGGFSEELLKNHFKLYEGYVLNTNKLLDFLKNKESGTPEYSELQRRFAWEFNGMRLHELYFGNMSAKKTFLKEGALKEKISKIFGSFENWQKNFENLGMMRGIGWVILAYDKEGDELFNLWIGEHDLGHLAGAIPLFVMDVFEHAYIADYSLNRKEYIDNFMKNINWIEIEKRFEEK